MSVEPVVSRCDCCGTQYTARAWPWLESLGGDGSRRVCAVPGCGSTVDRRPVAANARGGAPRPRAVTVPVEVTIVEVPLPSVPEARVFSAFVESTDPHDCGPVVFLSQGQSLAITGPGFDFEGTLAEFCDAMRARSTMAEASEEMRHADEERRHAREWMAEAAQRAEAAHRHYGDGKATVTPLRLVRKDGDR